MDYIYEKVNNNNNNNNINKIINRERKEYRRFYNGQINKNSTKRK